MSRTGRLVMAMALLWIGFGVGGPAKADISLSTPAGLSAGDSFRFVFVTDGTTDATSTDINSYNSFVNVQAAGATYNGSVVSWDAIASTPTVNAIDNVGQSPISGVYLTDGTLVTPTTTASGLWSGTILHTIDETLTGGPPETVVWTGTNADGVATPGFELGGAQGFAIIGGTSFTNAGWAAEDGQFVTAQLPMYGISQVLVVPAAVAVPEPSTLLTAGSGIIAGIAFGWSRRRREERRRRPVGQPDTAE